MVNLKKIQELTKTLERVEGNLKEEIVFEFRNNIILLMRLTVMYAFTIVGNLLSPFFGAFTFRNQEPAILLICCQALYFNSFEYSQRIY